MKGRVNYIPEGYHTVTPQLTIRGSSAAVEFYKKAFGAQVNFRQDRSDGTVMHAALKIGDSIIMLAEECRQEHAGHEKCAKSPAQLNGSTVSLYLYVKDADGAYHKALEHGAKSIMPLEDMFWGDRIGTVGDPYGYTWTLATRKEIVSPDQLKERMKGFCEKYAGAC